MLVIGSRGSQLALWQARWVQARLASLGIETRIEVIKTTGDRVTGVPLSSSNQASIRASPDPASSLGSKRQAAVEMRPKSHST